MWITVKAYKQQLSIENLNNSGEKLDNLGILDNTPFVLTKTAIDTNDILEFYEYKGTKVSNKTVIVFADDRNKLVIAESYDDFFKKIEESSSNTQEEQQILYLIEGNHEENTEEDNENDE